MSPAECIAFACHEYYRQTYRHANFDSWKQERLHPKYQTEDGFHNFDFDAEFLSMHRVFLIQVVLKVFERQAKADFGPKIEPAFWLPFAQQQLVAMGCLAEESSD